MENLLGIIAILFSLVTLVVSIFAFLNSRKVESVKDGIHEEINSIATSNKRLIERISRLEKDQKLIQTELNKLKTRPEVIEKPQPVIEPPKPTTVKEEKQIDDSPWQDVIFLAKQGVGADKIARDLNITRGEVDLILGLHQFKPKD